MDSEKEAIKYQQVITPEKIDAMQKAQDRITELLIRTVRIQRKRDSPIVNETRPRSK